MNPSGNLTVIAKKFKLRIDKLCSEAITDTSRIDRYCIISISQLNNFLRSYLLSIRAGARDSFGNVPYFGKAYPTDDLLIDEIVRLGSPWKWKQNKIGTWNQKDEPALHCPRVFLNVVNGLQCSNMSTITSAMADSWKVDVLRNVRNYFAHRSFSTEKMAVESVRKKYGVDERASLILVETDKIIAERVINDIHAYLSDFSQGIC